MVRSRVPASSVAVFALTVGCAALTACQRSVPAETRPTPSAAVATNAPVSPVRVEINAQGFEPARVFVGPDHPLVFRRTTNESCATALVFPEYGIERALPLNTDVSVPLPDTAEGELAFQCGSGKQRGKLFARLAG